MCLCMFPLLARVYTLNAFVLSYSSGVFAPEHVTVICILVAYCAYIYFYIISAYVRVSVFMLLRICVHVSVSAAAYVCALFCGC